MTRWLLLFALLTEVSGESWTWVDAQKNIRTETEFDAILKEHIEWRKSKTKGGKRANLSGANLIGANLTLKDLSFVNLQHAHFEAPPPELQDPTSLDHVGDLTVVDFHGASLDGAYLNNVSLDGADLSGASLGGAHLNGATLEGTNLEDTELGNADLAGVKYQPKKNPPAAKISTARGLDQLIWSDNPEPLVALRKAMIEAGFDDAAKRVTASIRRHGQSSLSYLLFDWTCAWGSDWRRPLLIVTLLALVCTAIYLVGMHFGGAGGLYLVATGQRVATDKRKEQSRRIQIELPQTFVLKQLLLTELRATGTAFYFSLISLFTISFGQYTFGNWIRLLLPREFDIRASGWMRVVAGVQSLLSAPLVVLALLSYFGHPFA